MKKLMMICMVVASLLAVSGCGTTKSRSVDARGMWISDSGQMAIGQVQVDAIPENVDSAIIHYAEDTAWLSPSTKTHKIDVVLTGTNSTVNASRITEAICKAFVSIVPAGGTRSSASASTNQGTTAPSPDPGTTAPSPECPECSVPGAQPLAAASTCPECKN